MNRAVHFLIPILGLLHVVSSNGAPAPSSLSRTQLVSEIEMERTICYGRCPEYTVTIRRTGEVVFDGRQYVSKPGVSSGAISSDDFGLLLQAIERVHFFELGEKFWNESHGCKEVWTDNPSVKITVKYAALTKKVTYYYGCRGLSVADDIVWLAMTIDEIGNTKEWIGNPK